MWQAEYRQADLLCGWGGGSSTTADATFARDDAAFYLVCWPLRVPAHRVASTCHARTHHHAFPGCSCRAFAEVLEVVRGDAARVCAVTSAEKAKAVNDATPGFWDIKKVL